MPTDLRVRRVSKVVVNEDECLLVKAEATIARKQDMEPCDPVVNP